MHVAVTSIFRNSEHYLFRYFFQISGLQALLEARGDSLLVLAGEGDSQDRTRRMLMECFGSSRLDGAAVDTTHGGPRFGSVINARRFAQMAEAYNRVWRHIPDATDVVLFLESDLIWDPATMLALIDRLDDNVHAAVPMVFHEPGCKLYGDPDGKWFFDRWAYRLNGRNFTNQPPYHPAVNGRPVLLESAGSCVAIREDARQGISFPPEDMVVGMTRSLGGVWLQPDLEILHPNES